MRSAENAFRMFCQFRAAIKDGGKPLLIGSDYVAMSRESYDKLMEKTPGAMDARNDSAPIWYDEAASVDPDIYHMLFERKPNGTIKA